MSASSGLDRDHPHGWQVLATHIEVRKQLPSCKWDDECVLGLNIFIINSFLCDQNGMRAKLKAADSNEIDTMFMDKRSSVDEDSKGNILVGQWCMQGCQWAVTSVTAEQACVRLVVTSELDCS